MHFGHKLECEFKMLLSKYDIKIHKHASGHGTEGEFR